MFSLGSFRFISSKYFCSIGSKSRSSLVASIQRNPYSLSSFSLHKPGTMGKSAAFGLSSTKIKPISHVSKAFKSSMASKRPISPHVSIYQPQLTWVMSIMHRVTGAGLAAGFYGFGIAYALSGNQAPQIGDESLWSYRSTQWIYATLPLAIIYVTKVGVVAPFWYHTFNGVRHLLWDFKYCLSLKQVYMTGYAVNAGTVLATLASLTW